MITPEQRARLDMILSECVKRGILPESEGILLSLAIMKSALKQTMEAVP